MPPPLTLPVSLFYLVSVNADYQALDRSLIIDEWLVLLEKFKGYADGVEIKLCKKKTVTYERIRARGEEILIMICNIGNWDCMSEILMHPDEGFWL